MDKTVPSVIKPNIDRVIIKPILIDKLNASGVIISGQLKAGENLLYGEIREEGDTRFKKGQGVFYSEYSSSNVFDVRQMIDGDKSFSEVQKEGLVVVAQDDILAYYDTGEVSKTS